MKHDNLLGAAKAAMLAEEFAKPQGEIATVTEEAEAP